MLLTGLLSYLSPPPARLQPLPWVEEDFGCCFWRVGTSVLATLTVKHLPNGPLGLGETKTASLTIADEEAQRVLIGEWLLVGTAQQEGIGQFLFQTVAPDPFEEPALRQRPVPPVVWEPLTVSEQHLLAYLKEWVQQTDRLCTILREEFQLGFTRVSRLEREARMGASGNVKGIRYGFHGIGCHFKTKGLELDVDFDSQGDWQGFDWWRIRMFIKWNHPAANLSDTHLKQGLASLVQKKWLYQTGSPQDHDLFYVTPPF